MPAPRRATVRRAWTATGRSRDSGSSSQPGDWSSRPPRRASPRTRRSPRLRRRLAGAALHARRRLGRSDAPRVVIWTRLAPDPLADGGMPPQGGRPLGGGARRGMRQVVQPRHRARAAAAAHTVHVDRRRPGARPLVLLPLLRGTQDSPVGRTRTPAHHAPAQPLRFGFVSCQDFQNGFYTAYATWPPRISTSSSTSATTSTSTAGETRPARRRRRARRAGGRSGSIYRVRHAQYKLDPALQATHARLPVHRVPSTTTRSRTTTRDAISEDGARPRAFLQRRAAAYQRVLRAPAAARSRAAERAAPCSSSAGSLRQAGRVPRARHAAIPDRPTVRRRPQAPAPTRSSRADDDRRRAGAVAARGLDALAGAWNVLAQQVMFTEVDLGPPPGCGPRFQHGRVGRLRGRAPAAARLPGGAHAGEPGRPDRRHPLELGGDISSTSTTRRRHRRAEFVGTSITSDFPAGLIPAVQATLPDNPHIRYFDGLYRGYVRCEVTPELWRDRLPRRRDRDRPDAPVSTCARSSSRTACRESEQA